MISASKNLKFAIVLIAACALSTAQAGSFSRSKAALRAFVKEQACPSTGKHRLPCPGYQIDHVQPLKCQGPDTPANMQWLTVDAHKAKTAREAKDCRSTKEARDR